MGILLNAVCLGCGYHAANLKFGSGMIQRQPFFIVSNPITKQINSTLSPHDSSLHYYHHDYNSLSKKEQETAFQNFNLAIKPHHNPCPMCLNNEVAFIHIGEWD